MRSPVFRWVVVLQFEFEHLSAVGWKFHIEGSVGDEGFLFFFAREEVFTFTLFLADGNVEAVEGVLWNLDPRTGRLVVKVGDDEDEFLAALAEESILAMFVHAFAVVDVHDVEESGPVP